MDYRDNPAANENAEQSHPLGDRETGMADNGDELATLDAEVTAMADANPPAEHTEPDSAENPADAFRKAQEIEAAQAAEASGSE